MDLAQAECFKEFGEGINFYWDLCYYIGVAGKRLKLFGLKVIGNIIKEGASLLKIK